MPSPLEIGYDIPYTLSKSLTYIPSQNRYAAAGPSILARASSCA